jgi:hypothetical protein
MTLPLLRVSAFNWQSIPYSRAHECGARGRNIDDCPIAKTSRVDCQNFPALFGKISGLLYGQVVAEFPVGWGKARAGLRFDEGSATAVRGRSQGLIPGRQATYNNFRRASSSGAIP